MWPQWVHGVIKGVGKSCHHPTPSKLVASKAGNTLLSSIVLMFILFRLKCFIQPKYFQKKTDFRTQMARWFSDILVPKHLLPHKRIKGVVRKKRDYVGKIPKWWTSSPHPPVWEFSHFFTVFFLNIVFAIL